LIFHPVSIKTKGSLSQVFSIHDHLICLFPNPSSDEIKVRFRQGNDVFFEDQSKPGSDLQKKYNVSNLPVGEYKVSLSSGAYFYTYPLSIEK